MGKIEIDETIVNTRWLYLFTITYYLTSGGVIILSGKRKDDDLVVRAQEIIDSYVLLERKKRKNHGVIDVVLWSLVAIFAALTLFLYIYLR